MFQWLEPASLEKSCSIHPSVTVVPIWTGTLLLYGMLGITNITTSSQYLLICRILRLTTTSPWYGTVFPQSLPIWISHPIVSFHNYGLNRVFWLWSRPGPQHQSRLSLPHHLWGHQPYSLYQSLWQSDQDYDTRILVRLLLHLGSLWVVLMSVGVCPPPRVWRLYRPWLLSTGALVLLMSWPFTVIILDGVRISIVTSLLAPSLRPFWPLVHFRSLIHHSHHHWPQFLTSSEHYRMNCYVYPPSLQFQHYEWLLSIG